MANLKKYFKKLRKKNWKADRAAFKIKMMKKLDSITPYVAIIVWYSAVIGFFTGFVTGNIRWEAFVFGVAVYFIYEKIKDDIVEGFITVRKAV